MKQHIAELVSASIEILKAEGVLPQELEPRIMVENTKDKTHGDFASNIALTMAKAAKCAPRQLAEKLCGKLPKSDNISNVTIAGPGFINFFITSASSFAVVGEVLAAGASYGLVDAGSAERVQVEFVSANPTGPLHVGHGRGAAYGASVADLLQAAGYDVQREYYVNDAGRQMNILAASVWLRYLERCGLTLTFPSNGYKGEYVYEIADQLFKTHNEQFSRSLEQVFTDIPVDEPEGGDKELHIDALIDRCVELLGETDYRTVFDAGLDGIRDDIRDDLAGFGVKFPNATPINDGRELSNNEETLHEKRTSHPIHHRWSRVDTHHSNLVYRREEFTQRTYHRRSERR